MRMSGWDESWKAGAWWQDQDSCDGKWQQDIWKEQVWQRQAWQSVENERHEVQTGTVQNNEGDASTSIVLWSRDHPYNGAAKVPNGDQVTILDIADDEYKVVWRGQEGRINKQHIQAHWGNKQCWTHDVPESSPDVSAVRTWQLACKVENDNVAEIHRFFERLSGFQELARTAAGRNCFVKFASQACAQEALDKAARAGFTVELAYRVSRWRHGWNKRAEASYGSEDRSAKISETTNCSEWGLRCSSTGSFHGEPSVTQCLPGACGVSTGESEHAMTTSAHTEQIQFKQEYLQQRNAMNGWLVRWNVACHENPAWLVLRKTPEGWICPWCIICSAWAEIGHLNSQKCQKRVHLQDIHPGPFLKNLLRNDPQFELVPEHWQLEPQIVGSNAAPPQLRNSAPTQSLPIISVTTASCPLPRPPIPQPQPDTVDAFLSSSRECFACANPDCDFLVHKDPQYGGYCCKTCCEWHFKEHHKSWQIHAKTKHGKFCRKVLAPQGFPKAPELPAKDVPPIWHQQTTGSILRPVQLPVGQWRANKPVVLQQGVDLDSNACGRLESLGVCCQVGKLAVLIEKNNGNTCTLVIRMRIQLQNTGWVTLAQIGGSPVASLSTVFCDNTVVVSDFEAPPGGWRSSIIDSAIDVDFHFDEAEHQYSYLLDLQEEVRTDPVNQDLRQRRDAARTLAFFKFRRWLDEWESTCCVPGWFVDGSSRQARAVEARVIVRKLDLGTHIDITSEISSLEERREASVKTRLDLEDASHELKKARIRKKSNDEIRELQLAYKREQSKARQEEKRYSKTISRLREYALEHTPELLPHLVESIDDRVRNELTKLNPLEQLNVRKVLSEDRTLSHYDDAWEDMKTLSRGRHCVKQTSQEGVDCVLKMFSLDGRGLEVFLKEIVRHVKLQSAHVVPLQCAFVDMALLNGFLQFEPYSCDLDSWLLQKSRRRRPHRLGEPASAGKEDNIDEVLRLVQAMVQSVSHLHSLDVRHGDLKPSNWLMDEKSHPILCDLESAIDQGGQGTTMQMCSTSGFKLHTPEFTAPERIHDFQHPVTKQADMWSLGKSIEKVLDFVADSTSLKLVGLQKLSQKMLIEIPNQRISALEAEKECWKLFNADTGSTRQVWCKDVSLFYTQGSCGGRFQDGRSLDDLIAMLVKNPQYALKHQDLVVDVVQKGCALMCIDNRRLHCFHEADNQLRRQLRPEKLEILVRLHRWEPIWERYFNHLDENNKGKDIRVRRVWRPQW